jgi:hypothetical protein
MNQITVKGSGNVRRIILTNGSDLGAVSYMGTRINRWEASVYDTVTNCYFPFGNYVDLATAVAALCEQSWPALSGRWCVYGKVR